MSRFLIGLLLGLLAGIAGTSAFLIVYGGGDYLVSTSPRVRELEASLRHVDEDRDWLKSRLRESTEATQRLESRFEALASRFESLANESGSNAPAPTPSDASAGADAASTDAPADAPVAAPPSSPDAEPDGAAIAPEGAASADEGESLPATAHVDPPSESPAP